MDNLYITGTKCTLEVNFDAGTGTLEIAGESYPENIYDFFQPLYKWIEEYLKDPDKSMVLNLKITYLNSTSTRCVLDFLTFLEDYRKNGRNIRVNWFYEEDDDILETAEFMNSNLDLPINITPLPEEAKRRDRSL
ncbi:MAG: DUF1987 domain-containing protein [Candidatus Aminicenantes bacterium]|nr:DUF1987 domain-containing protein [Candidatus Aminicenantes bacterium]